MILDPGKSLRNDYLEWVRLRAGALEFAAPRGVQLGRQECPVCRRSSHGAGVGPYLLECPALAQARARCPIFSDPGEAAGATGASQRIKSLLADPTDPATFEKVLLFIGPAVRRHREGRAGAAQPEARRQDEEEEWSSDEELGDQDAESTSDEDAE